MKRIYCNKCKSLMVLKVSKVGRKFYGCSSFPNCKNSICCDNNGKIDGVSVLRQQILDKFRDMRSIKYNSYDISCIMAASLKLNSGNIFDLDKGECLRCLEWLNNDYKILIKKLEIIDNKEHINSFIEYLKRHSSLNKRMDAIDGNKLFEAKLREWASLSGLNSDCLASIWLTDHYCDILDSTYESPTLSNGESNYNYTNEQYLHPDELEVIKEFDVRPY